MPNRGIVDIARKLDLRIIQAEMARRQLKDFVRLAWPIVEPSKAFIPNWHIDAICTHLQAVSEGHIKHLVITIPPGHAKSLIVSVLWPAWQWIRKKPDVLRGPDGPGSRGIYCSYDVQLAIRDSRRCRSLLASEWY